MRPGRECEMSAATPCLRQKISRRKGARDIREPRERGNRSFPVEKDARGNLHVKRVLSSNVSFSRGNIFIFKSVHYLGREVALAINVCRDNSNYSPLRWQTRRGESRISTWSWDALGCIASRSHSRSSWHSDPFSSPPQTRRRHMNVSQ